MSAMDQDNTYNMTQLIRQISYVPINPICRICHQSYPKKWCNGLCFYCANFLPTRDTRYSILKDIEWYFIRSGEDDRNIYYLEYIENLNRWCCIFRVTSNKQDLSLECELRSLSYL